MADKNQLKASQIDFADDDPFAELTRIMGFDPREPVRKPDAAPAVQPAAPQPATHQQAPASYAQQPEEEDFSLDLEKELLGGLDFDDEPAQPVQQAMPEFESEELHLPPATEPDFDFADDFDAAMASETFDAPVAAHESRFEDELEAAAPVVAPAPVEDDFDLGLSDDDMHSLGDFDVAPAAHHDDSNIDLDLDAALSNLDIDRSPAVQAAAAPQQAPAAEADDIDFGFFDETDFQLADEDAPQAAAEPQFSPAFDGPAADLKDAEPAFELHAEPAFEAPVEAEVEPELDESAFQFSDDEFRFEELPPLEQPAPVAAQPVADEPEEMAFDDLDLGDEFVADETRNDDFAAPAVEAPAPQVFADEPVAAPKASQGFEFSVPAFVPRKLPTSPMDIAAEEFRQREVEPTTEFNLEDELNALLGNKAKPAAEAPAPAALPTMPAAVPSFEPSFSQTFQPSARGGFEAAPAQHDYRAQEPSFDAPEHPVELDDNLDWDLDASFAEDAAPEQVEAPQPSYAQPSYAQPAYSEPAYAEPVYEADRYEAEEDIALDLDDVFDEMAEENRQPEPSYRDALAGLGVGAAAGAAAGAASRGYSDYSARPFEVPSFQPQPLQAAPSYGSAARVTAAAASSHRDPVVRADPLKEDPLNVIQQLAEQYSRKEPASYGRGAAAGASRYQDEDVEDDLDISYDFDDQPDIDTIEVSDRAVALADDFDIPELPEEDNVPQATAYDDIDAEFSSLLSELKSEPQAAQPVAGYDDPLSGGFRSQPYRAAAAPQVHTQRPTASAVPPRGQQQPEQDAFSFDMNDFGADLDGSNGQGGMNYAADDYQFDNDFDPDMAPGHLAEENSRRPIPRKLLIGGLIAGVALIGGLGAFAFSYGGGGTGAPELVRADDTPSKIRPENPGGATVPNQDNKVYQRVSGEGAANGPQQENLVTTAEEPLDVTPPADEEDMAVTGKSEDRIEQIVQDAEGQSDAELAAVAPRKVRTMVVKPDGTLVEREEEPGASPGTSNEQTDTIPAAPPAAEGIPGATQDVPALAPVPGETEVAAAPARNAVGNETTASTPATAPIAPQRPTEQPVDVVGEVKPEQVAAATTAAAAAGTWAMQIASQPSEAAAQSSYQDLARRYGSVLNGRDVNIVKAEIAGKGTFWRVRVPAPTRNEAINLCEQYKAAGGNCFVSR